MLILTLPLEEATITQEWELCHLAGQKSSLEEECLHINKKRKKLGVAKEMQCQVK